jgi:hypothetical protein
MYPEQGERFVRCPCRRRPPQPPAHPLSAHGCLGDCRALKLPTHSETLEDVRNIMSQSGSGAAVGVPLLEGATGSGNLPEPSRAPHISELTQPGRPHDCRQRAKRAKRDHQLNRFACVARVVALNTRRASTLWRRTACTSAAC